MAQLSNLQLVTSRFASKGTPNNAQVTLAITPSIWFINTSCLKTAPTCHVKSWWSRYYIQKNKYFLRNFARNCVQNGAQSCSHIFNSIFRGKFACRGQPSIQWCIITAWQLGPECIIKPENMEIVTTPNYSQAFIWNSGNKRT